MVVMPPNRQRVEFLLSCRHTVTFTEPLPRLGESVVCLRCSGESVVVRSLAPNAPGVVGWYCPECQCGHRYKLDREGAERAARRHYRTRGSVCPVAVLDGGAVVYRYGQSDNPLGLAVQRPDGTWRVDLPIEPPF